MSRISWTGASTGEWLKGNFNVAEMGALLMELESLSQFLGK